MPPLSTDMQSALHLLACVFLAQDKVGKALPILEFLIARCPTDATLRLALAFALLRAGRAADAIDALAALQFSSDAAVHFLRGKAFAQAGRTNEAQAAFLQYRRLRFAPAERGAASAAVPPGGAT